MAFHEVRFPASVSFGATGGPERRTEIVELAGGHERRAARWSQGRRRYDAGLGLRSLDDVHAVLAFFEARMGRLHGFRWKDWFDHKSCTPSETPGPLDCAIGVGDGTTTAFRLIKTYVSGPASHAREITKPVVGSVRVAVGGAELSAGDVDIDPTTGVVTLATPPFPGAQVTAGFVFDVPVRFDADLIEVNLAAFEAGEIPSIPLVEVRV